MLRVVVIDKDRKGHQRQRTVFALPKLTISDTRYFLVEITEKTEPGIRLPK